jgi:predicted molibdopterin-dependent oxidoreductase YjgC
MSHTFTLDGKTIPFEEGQTIMQAASHAGVFIPHLCYHPEFKPHGSCKLCTVKVNGRQTASCTMRAMVGMVVESETEEINAERRALTQMLFVEGNHFCPSCEKSGDCQLQATAYHLGMMSPHYDHFFPNRPVDASHPEVLLDFNRCILCSLCAGQSRCRWQERVRAFRPGYHNAPDRQCQVRPACRHGFPPLTRRRRFARSGSFSRNGEALRCRSANVPTTRDPSG